MIVEKILGNISNNTTQKENDRVSIEWYELGKKLIKKTSSSGIEIGIKIDHPLKDGDILYEDDKKIIYIDVLPNDLVSIHVHSIQEMGRLCFELGNRHLALAISDSTVKVPYDEPTLIYLKKLGFEATRVNDKFTEFTTCHMHSHSHES